MAELANKPAVTTRGTLYAMHTTSCSRRAICALVEAGVPFDYRPIDFAKREQKELAFLEIQPFGKVPAWVERGGSDPFTLFESRAIMRHVADGSPLLPATAKGRALMDQWTSIEYSNFTPPFMPAYYDQLRRSLGAAPNLEAQAQAREGITPTLDLMEHTLAESAFLAGESFSCADLTFLPLFEYLEVSGCGQLLESRPAVAAWWARCSARESWQYCVSGRVAERAV
ncbi:glutathione S-transferase [Pavlovales sp. CCMP2436]|nr:glutathione S-transferase [Pavlovales sp. CCMP2436]